MKEIQGKSILAALGFELSGVTCNLFYIFIVLYIYCFLVHLPEPRNVNLSFLPLPLLVPRLFVGGKIISLVLMLNFNKFVVCCYSS